MILNLDFSKLVNVGSSLLDKEGVLYKHNFYIVEDSLIQDKYYLIDFINIKNKTKADLYDKEILLLEEVYILEVSLKKDIPKQIYSFLKMNGYINDINCDIDDLFDIDISYFDVRYKYYERNRITDLDIISSEIQIYCNYSKHEIVNRDEDYNMLKTITILDDITLYKIKKVLKSL